MTLKEQMASDISTVILNTSELSECISYEGDEVLAIVEENIGEPIQNRGNGERAEAVFGRSLFVYMAAPAILPVQGRRVTMGREGKEPERWTVKEVNDDSGMVRVLLEAVDS